ncbi:SMI1/KNR4 family protein [Streptomyces sp. NPDC003688]
MSHTHSAQPLRHIAPLTDLCPPPPDGGRNVEWADVERTLGIPLPADYKQLVQTYGGGLFVDLIWLLEPGCPEAMYDLVAQTTDREEILTELWAAGERRPPELDEDGARLVPWGYAEGAGHFLYWLIRPGTDPDDWTVVLNEGRGPLWEFHPVSCSEFLLEVLAGTTPSPYFTDVDDIVAPEDRTRFIPNAEILNR